MHKTCARRVVEKLFPSLFMCPLSHSLVLWQVTFSRMGKSYRHRALKIVERFSEEWNPALTNVNLSLNGQSALYLIGDGWMVNVYGMLISRNRVLAPLRFRPVMRSRPGRNVKDQGKGTTSCTRYSVWSSPVMKLPLLRYLWCTT